MKDFDKEPEKVYFTAGEVAKVVDESVSCVRYWATQMNMALNRGPRRNIRYTVKQVNDLTALKSLVRIKRYTLEGAINHLKFLEQMSKDVDMEEREILQSVPLNHSYHYGKTQLK